MKQLEIDPVAKRLYEPPKIVAISLRPEEAVLGNCKISASPGLGFPTSCNAAGNCKTIGS
jgi:hypothetical protein